MNNTRKMTGRWLLQGGRTYDPFRGEYLPGDVLIHDGMIEALSITDPPSDGSIIDCSGLIITLAFTDLHAHFREPGREDKETLATGARAALAGGISSGCVMSNTNPLMDNLE